MSHTMLATAHPDFQCERRWNQADHRLARGL
jgi:hypothetical protein